MQNDVPNIRRAFRAVSDGRSVPDRIAEQIKKAIFQGKFKPGERLPSEIELCEMFNTSRVTVRDALRILKNSGLVYVRRGARGGTFVSHRLAEDYLAGFLNDFIQWNHISVRDVMQTRNIIEPQIAYLAALHATSKDIHNIREAIRELEQAFRTRDKFTASDENFHKYLAVASKNPLLAVFQASVIEVLFEFLSSVTWSEGHKNRIISYHKEIAAKIENRDPEGARETMEEHLKDMGDILNSLADEKQLSLDA